MALPDNFVIQPGTAIVWGEAGGTGVTATLSLDGLADGSARQGNLVDLGATFPDEYMAQLVVETGTAPTAGLTASLYLACTWSTSGSFYPAGTSGSDGAWPSDGDEDQWALQLGAPATTLVATNDGNTIQAQAPVLWRPTGRYVTAIVDNNLGVAFRDQATASANLSRVILVPLQAQIVD